MRRHRRSVRPGVSPVPLRLPLLAERERIGGVDCVFARCPLHGPRCPSSPLTKSGSADSLRLRRFGRVIGHGDGAVGGGSGRPDGDVGGDAALAGTRADRLQELLREGGFDAFVEGVCKPYYAPRMGAPSLPPGRYFRMHMIAISRGSTASA